MWLRGEDGGILDAMVLRRFLPRDAEAGRFDPEMAVMRRLGATPEACEALRARLEEVEVYT